MPDKKSIAEALKMVRKRNRLSKKSLAGIGRTFYYGEPAKAIVSSNNPEQK